MPPQILLSLRLASALDTVIRVPAIFAIDALINNSSFASWALFADDNTTAVQQDDLVDDSRIDGGDADDEIFDSINDRFDMVETHILTSIYPFILRLLGIIVAFVVFVLPTGRLIETYKWLVSVGALMGCLWVNAIFFDYIKLADDIMLEDNYMKFAAHFFVLCLFSLVYNCTCNGPRSALAQRLITFILVFPSFLNICAETHFGNLLTNFVPILSVSLIALYNIVNIVLLIPHLYLVIQQSMIMTGLIVRHNGLHILLENEWLRLRVPDVLRLFWLIRFGEHLLFSKVNMASDWADNQIVAEDFMNVSKRLLISGCDTLVAVFGMTSVVASLTHYLCSAVQLFLLTDDAEDNSFGTVSAILFLILALQTGLTGLESEKRFVRLCRNFCLLFTAILHFIHNIVSPILMSLSASRNRSRKHHGRALSVCFLLVATPFALLYYLWNTHNVSTWLLAVTAFSIEVIIKVIISFLIYSLFMIDAARNSFWEKLDDYVYYVRATGNTIEFLFGIFLFFNGTWILIFEAGGTIRACLMCIHAYFNIWMQAKAGWKTFVRRRTAVNKINSFPEASPEQLLKLNDVCAICYQEMYTARMTVCKHYFHALCLRKWLYIQDRCPMCHKALYEIESNPDATDTPNEENVANENDARQQAVPNVAVAGEWSNQ